MCTSVYDGLLWVVDLSLWCQLSTVGLHDKFPTSLSMTQSYVSYWQIMHRTWIF